MGNIVPTDQSVHEYRDRIVGYLEKQSMDICARFIEYIIKNNNDRTPEFHNKLALWYLERLRNPEKKEWRDNQFEQEMELDSKRQTLLGFLEASESYRPERLLSFFPSNTLHLERAILLSRLGRHDQALSIYIRKLNSIELAERYCDKWWQSGKRSGATTGGTDVYMTLLQVLLGSNDDSMQRIDEAIHVLSHYGERFNPVYVSNFLPSTLSLQKLCPFFHRSLTTLAQDSHRLLLMRNIVQTEQVQVRCKRLEAFSDSIIIRERSVCRVCGKRILATSAFVVLPGVRGKREWVHYACRNIVLSD